MAIDEERYKDAAYIRDHAGAGLVSTMEFLDIVCPLLSKFL
jgi:hypothetical protein